MKLCTLIFLVIVTATSCSSPVAERQEELDVMKEMVLLRTEGLALTEFVSKRAADPEVQQLCNNLRDYYQRTHPDFLMICTGREMALSNDDFTVLWEKMSMRFSGQDDSLEHICLQLCEENIQSSIRLYEGVIEKRNWEDISYFSFIALPDLYNQRAALGKLKELALHQQAQANL